MKFENKDKLVMLMLCEIYEALNVKGTFDPKLISSALIGGHDWAIDWEYGSLFPTEVDSEEDLKETSDILDMWGFIERAFAALTEPEKDRVKASNHGFEPVFTGFDGNNEDHYHIANFLVNNMNRFKEFAGRSLNSHSESITNYRRSYAKFDPMRGNLGRDQLTADQLIEILSR